MKPLLLVLLSGVVLAAAGQTSLRQQALPTTGAVDNHVVVGRARCGQELWLLTDAPALVRIRVDAHLIVAMAIRGLDDDERPFGLACARDELWTLAGYRALARLSPSGAVLSRIKLRQPRLGVFGIGDWLLLQQSPTSSGMPLLARTSPADINRSTTWPGVVSLRRPPTRTELSSALVACGLPFGNRLPCWIASETRISISDGVASHTAFLQPQFLKSIATDPAVPIWDVALTSPADGWILASAAPGPGGRRVGGRLTRTSARGDDEGHVDLAPRARVIVSASARSAIVLTSVGTLMEVAP